MRVFALVSTLFALLLTACGGSEAQPDHQAEWRQVLDQKAAASKPDAPAEQKQVYADSVRAFVDKHPDHGRAREVWQRMQVEFAAELAERGRHQDAIRIYRAVLSHDARNEEARRGLALSADRLAVTREKLLKVEKGMSQRQVANLLGKPSPGWQRETRRSAATVEAWYYRTPGGGVAAVYFRDGKVFAAEAESHALRGRLGS
jgi:hypothetical protein